MLLLLTAGCRSSNPLSWMNGLTGTTEGQPSTDIEPTDDVQDLPPETEEVALAEANQSTQPWPSDVETADEEMADEIVTDEAASSEPAEVQTRQTSTSGTSLGDFSAAGRRVSAPPPPPGSPVADSIQPVRQVAFEENVSTESTAPVDRELQYGERDLQYGELNPLPVLAGDLPIALKTCSSAWATTITRASWKPRSSS